MKAQSPACWWSEWVAQIAFSIQLRLRKSRIISVRSSKVMSPIASLKGGIAHADNAEHLPCIKSSTPFSNHSCSKWASCLVRIWLINWYIACICSIWEVEILLHLDFTCKVSIKGLEILALATCFSVILSCRILFLCISPEVLLILVPIPSDMSQNSRSRPWQQ